MLWRKVRATGRDEGAWILRGVPVPPALDGPESVGIGEGMVLTSVVLIFGGGDPG